MTSTAPTPAWPGPWRPAASATCWPSPATGGCRSMPPPRAPPHRSPPTCPAPPAQPAPAPPRSAGQVRSAGAGAHAPRRYAWAWLALHPRAAASTQPGSQGHARQPRSEWSLLVRRNLRTGELAFYRCYTPTPTTLAQLITVAGRRWSIEESFQSSKGLAGLDEHQVRRWTPWRRWTLLAMPAHALLAVLTAVEREHALAERGLIALTCAEVRRLLTTALAPLTAPVDALAHATDWSRWRRHHQPRAKTCHYAHHGARLS